MPSSLTHGCCSYIPVLLTLLCILDVVCSFYVCQLVFTSCFCWFYLNISQIFIQSQCTFSGNFKNIIFTFSAIIRCTNIGSSSNWWKFNWTCACSDSKIVKDSMEKWHLCFIIRKVTWGLCEAMRRLWICFSVWLSI